MKLCSIDILLASAKSEQAPLCIRLGRMFSFSHHHFLSFSKCGFSPRCVDYDKATSVVASCYGSRLCREFYL